MFSSCEASVMDYIGCFSNTAHNSDWVLYYYKTHLPRLLIYWQNTERNFVERPLLFYQWS